MTVGVKLEFLVVLLCVPAGQGRWSGTCSGYICAVRGSTVEMWCSFTYPQTQTVLRTVWFLQGQSDDVGLESLSQYTGRVQHQCRDNRCTMTISDVTEEDAKKYLLRVITTEDKYTFSSGVSLYVTDLRVMKEYDSWGTHYTGSCSSSCFFSVDSYVWYKNGVKVETRTQQSYGAVTSSNSYSCAVKGHEDLPSPPVCGDDYYCNKVIYTGSRRVCAPAGSSVKLSCSYSHTGARRSSFWFTAPQSQHWRSSERKDVSEDPRYSSHEDTSKGVSTLTITDLRESDSAQFLFKFTTSDFEWRSTLPGVSLTVTALQVQMRRVLQVRGSSTTVELTCHSSCRSPGLQSYVWFKNEDKVHVKKPSYEASLGPGDHVRCGLEGHDGHISAPLYNPSGPSVVQSPPGEVVEGRPVNLMCSFGPGRGFNYTWNKTSSLSQQQFVGRDLLLSPAGSSDSGEYSCSVDSEFGTRTSPSVVIDVQYAPRPPSVWATSPEVVEGASVNLTCSSDANPPANYTWYMAGDTTAVASGEIFTITEVRREQAGSYRCRVQNLRGHDEAVVNLGVVSEPIKAAAVGSVAALLLLLFILLLVVLFLVRKRKLSTPTSATRERAEYQSTSREGCDDAAAAPEGDVDYSVVNFVGKQDEPADPVYSNVTSISGHRRDVDVVYAAVRT